MMAESYITSVENLMTGRPGGGVPGGSYAPSPIVTAYSDSAASDPTIRTPKDAGYVQTRARFTSVPRRYHVLYNALTTHDKNLIYNFEKDTVNFGAESFTWRMPTSGGNIIVRFAALVRYTPWAEANYTRWTVEFDVETVGGI